MAKTPAGGVNKGKPVAKSRPVSISKHMSAEDIAALNNMNSSVRGYRHTNHRAYHPGGSLAMCHNNDR
jgi:hypothetical protein